MKAIVRRRIVVLAALAVLAAVPPASAGVNEAWQTHIRVSDFTDLIVAPDEVWCATGEGGLLRFDRIARTFTPIIKEPGALASNHLTCMTFDRLGRLWVGTEGSGVSRLSEDGTTWELVNAFDGLPVDSVTTMIASGDTLWIGTRRGIALWDGRQVLGSLPDGNTLSFDTTFAVPAIRGIGVLGDTLWLATQRGVGYARISTNLTDWRPANAGLPRLEVEGLVTNGRDLLVQCEEAVYRWQPDSAKWLPTGPLSVVHRLAVEDGQMYVTSSAGMFRHIVDGLYTQIAGAPEGTPADPDDPEPGAGPPAAPGHFAGTRQGLWEETGPNTWVLHPVPGPPGNGYSNIVVDGAKVYAATRLEGIGRWDGANWFHWLPGPVCNGCPSTFRNPSQVFAMLADGYSGRPDGSTWVACWGFAVDQFDDDPEPDVFTHHWGIAGDDARHTFAFGAAADSNGGRWFGLDSPDLTAVPAIGLDFYDSTGTYAGNWGPGAPAGSLVRGGKIRGVTVDFTGRVWIGYAGSANSGIDHFVRRPIAGYDFRTVPNTSTLDIWGMVAHGDNIWALTDADLKRINRTGNPPRIVQSLATPAGRPLGMRLIDASPDGSVWVASEEGVRWYRPNGTTQDLTTANSPLASNDVRAVAVERATGAVWFGTAEGLNRFDPFYQPPALPPGMPDTLQVYPNPATVTGMGVQLRLQGASPGYTGGIYDITGRLVHTFRTTSRAQVAWNGRDADGLLVKPGIYFVRAEGGGRQARARFVLLR